MDEINLGKYRHYSGKNYEVLGIARHSETLEEFVLYKPLYKDKKFGGCFFVRPRKMFLSKVRKNGKLIERFKYLGCGVR